MHGRCGGSGKEERSWVQETEMRSEQIRTGSQGFRVGTTVWEPQHYLLKLFPKTNKKKNNTKYSFYDF